jgi:hypothetical protein
MICPHCGKDTELLYVEGRRMTKEEALGLHRVLMDSLDSLQRQGAYGPGATTDLNERYDKRLREANALEVALGY